MSEKVKAELAPLRTGGVLNDTLEMLMEWAGYPHPRVAWMMSASPPDADVVRARSVLATKFIQETDFDVHVQIDYDVSFPHLQDLDDLVLRCAETRGIVGCIVPKKAYGRGFGGRFDDGKEYELFTNTLVELGPGQYVGGAATAYHRDVFRALVGMGVPYCLPQRMYPFFAPDVEDLGDGNYEYLSEDWAINAHCRRAGIPVHAYLKPLVLHHGRAAFSALDANPAMEPGS